MNLFTGEASDEFFGSDAPPAVRRLLADAATAEPGQRGSLLWTAQATAPDCLAVYYLLYKFHAQQRQFELAASAAFKGLARAAAQAGLPEDWRAALPASVDFSQVGPARFWLFTLKALAFIHLRRGQIDEAQAFLARIAEVDPAQSVGSEVTAALLQQAVQHRGQA